MPLGVDPEPVIGCSVRLVAALFHGLQVTQDICVGDHVSLATAQDDRGTVAVQQLVDENPHSLMTTDPTAWLPALEVGPQGFSRPGHRAHQRVIEKGVTSSSDTDMAFPPRSGERARWLMGSFSQKRDLLRDKEETSSAGQRQVTST